MEFQSYSDIIFSNLLITTFVIMISLTYFIIFLVLLREIVRNKIGFWNYFDKQDRQYPVRPNQRPAHELFETLSNENSEYQNRLSEFFENFETLRSSISSGKNLKKAEIELIVKEYIEKVEEAKNQNPSQTNVIQLAVKKN